MKGEISPAPWDLNGMGIMHFFWGPKRIDPFSGEEVSGVGGFIIARYDHSPVGPYNELLYIPGRHKLDGKTSFFISKIYVDSIDSVVSGQSNWGIPKELADINIEKRGKKIEMVASIGGKSLFDASIAHGSLTFPVTTKLIPIPLYQDWKGSYYFTKFVGSGSGSFGKLGVNSVDASRFADTREFRSLATLVVDPFKLTFPIAKIKHHDLTIL
ncbi:MAG: acetoacetate decarboxylase family protein [Cyclobacteriaceae bacterium]